MLKQLCGWAALSLMAAMPTVVDAATQFVVEAETVSGGAVITDADASGQQAVSRDGGGIYTWWVLPSGQVASGDYAVYVRARSIDGATHRFTDLAYQDETQIGSLAASVTSQAYHWYHLGDIGFNGASLRLSDWSDSGMAIDKVILEPIHSTTASAVAGGEVINDPKAGHGTAVTRGSDGIYTWWLPDITNLAHGMYSIYVRARVQGVSSATFTEHVTVNDTEVGYFPTSVSNTDYSWIPAGHFEFRGSSLRLSDYSQAGLVIDQVRLVQDKPLDPTLGLYHFWYGNAHLGGIRLMEAERVAGGNVIADSSASSSQAVSRDSVGIYTWWSLAAKTLTQGAQYSVDVRMRSIDGQAHNFGLNVTPEGGSAISQNTAVGTTDYRWYKALRSFQADGNALVIADWSDAGLAVDAIRLQTVTAQDSDYQRLNFYAPGAPNTSGISTSPGRISVLPQDNGQVYGYFRQDHQNGHLEEWMGISHDDGLSFEVQPQPVIAVDPGPTVPGFGSLVTAYDGSTYQTKNGYYMVFEGSGDHPFSSLIAYSADGLHDWSVQGALVIPTSYNSSASTPNVVQDVDTQQLYLQWVDVNADDKITTRHQASLDYLRSWNPAASWPAVAAIWNDPSYGALPQSPVGSWDGANFGAGNVLYEDGYYYMSTEGADAYTCSGNWGLGLARTSETQLADPSSWVKWPLNPLIMALNTGSCWIGYPQLVKMRDSYYLYYDDPGVDWTPTHIEELYRRAILLN